MSHSVLNRTVLLINIDYIKMSYFERDRVHHGILGIVEDPFPCLLSLSALTTVSRALA